MSTETYCTRASTLCGFANFLRSRHIDPAPLMAAAQISVQQLEQDNVTIPSLRVARLLELAAEAAANPHLGLDFAVDRGELALAYGEVCALSRSCANQETSLKTFIAHAHLVDQSATWSLQVDGNVAFLSRRSLLSAHAKNLQQTLLEIGSGYLTHRHAYGAKWKPLAVTFTHDRPADIRAYERFFQAPIRFSQEFNGFSYPAQLLQRKQPRHDPVRRRELECYAAKLTSSAQRELRDVIKTMISLHIHEPDYTLTDIAKEIGLGQRTLLRRLKQYDITYRDLLFETRMELAAGYLKSSSVPLVDIAQFVGYTALSTFSRAFNQWYGQPPSLWRSNQYSR